MKLFLRFILVLILLTSTNWWTFSQSESQDSNQDKQYNLECGDKTPACNDTPEQIKLYLSTMDAILKIIDEVPSERDENDTKEKDFKRVTDSAFSKRLNLSSFISDASDTLFNWWWVFDDYRAMEKWSSTFKRDAQKLQDMNFKILDITVLEQKQLLKKNIPKDIYEKINKELKKIKYITFWETGGSYNMEVAWEKYETLIILLSQINKMYSELYQLQFQSNIFKNLSSSWFLSYVYPWDTTKDKIDLESLWLLANWMRDFLSKVFVRPFEDIRNNVKQESEYVTIDHKEFLLLVRELENAYRCTHWKQNVCDDWTKKTRDKFKELFTETLQNDSEKSWHRIQDATSRLKWALFWWSVEDKKAAEERKQSLLEWRYWAWWKPSERWPIQSLKAFGAQLLEGARNSVDPAKKYFNKEESYSEQTNWSQQVSTATQWDASIYHENEDKYSGSSKKKDALDWVLAGTENKIYDSWKIIQTENQLQQNQLRVLENKVKTIVGSFDKYAWIKQRQYERDLLYLDTKTMTKQAVWLSIYVHAAANRFWDYDKDPESKYVSSNDSLSKMCEAQCTNLWSKKCREDL